MIKLLHDANGLRTFAVLFPTGDDPLSGLESFAREYGVSPDHLRRRSDPETGLALIDP